MNLLRAEARVLRAQVFLERGDGVAALELVRLVLSWAERHEGAGNTESLMRLVHARALIAVGQEDTARREIGIARERLLARAATVGDPELHRMFLERVPESAGILALAEQLG